LALARGTRIGPYEVLNQIGIGDGSNATPPSLMLAAIVRMLNPTGAGVNAPGTKSCARADVADAVSM
jgi:hypothetical protein